MNPILILLGFCLHIHTHCHGFTTLTSSSSSSSSSKPVSSFGTFHQATSYHGRPSTQHPSSDAPSPPPIHRHYLAANDADANNNDDDDDDDENYTDSSTSNGNEAISVIIDTNLSESNTQKLFAWIKCAFDYDDDSDESGQSNAYAYYYNNIELAIAAAFGSNLPKNSLPSKLLEMAMKKEGLIDDDIDYDDDDENSKSTRLDRREWEETLIGEPIGRRDRESASLGAMGAAQWTGQWMTRPHSLLDVRNFTNIDDWIKMLPRGCKRTLKKATPVSQNFTVVAKPIRGGHKAPHSSYAHFRCVIQHEVRLLSNRYGPSTNAFVNALAEGISRYMGTTRMAGCIREYRDTVSGKVIGFAHEVGKGRTIRGQWFYCDNDAATRYVWFHSVQDLIQRAIADERIDVVDLGPSGSDAFTELKKKYLFDSVVDWPSVADYSGDFHYEPDQNEVETMGNDMMRMIEALVNRQAARDEKRNDG